MRDSEERVCFSHRSSDAHRSSQKLQKNTQGRREFKPDKILSQEGKRQEAKGN